MGGECVSLLITCNQYMQGRRFNEMQEPANDALFIAQEGGWTNLEKDAQDYLDQVQQAIGQQQQMMQQQMMMPQQGQPGGPAVPVWLQQQGGGGEGGPQDSGP